MSESPTTEVDADLAAAVRATTALRTGFYVVVLLIALGGQVSGAMEALHMAWYVAAPAVGALELGGVVVLANADVRRRLGEHATLSRLLSAAIAGGAVAFNWLAHSNHLEGGFYGGMSLLGYLVWLMNTENKRRDRLRAKRQLPPTPPAYEMVGHWLRHPWLTRRARSLAKATPALGLYDSLGAAAVAVRTDRRRRALAKVLHRKIRQALDGTTADIAVAVYDLDKIADRLTDRADYDGLTDLFAADLAPARIAAGKPRKKAKHDRPSASSSVAAQDRPQREPISDFDRVWISPFPQPPSAPSGTSAAAPSAGQPLRDPDPTDDRDERADDRDDLLDGARTVAAKLTARGVSVSRDNLAREMRAAGYPVSNDRASTLVRQLRTAGRPDESPRTTNGRRPELTGSAPN